MVAFAMKDYGFITDVRTKINGKRIKSYGVWTGIINRCYNSKNKRYRTYGGSGIYVCEEWKLFSNFKDWYDKNYIDGYEVDKDLSGLGYYGPDSCAFISKAENIRISNINMDYSKARSRVGKKNAMAKDVKYYETFASSKSGFRRICNNQGWDIHMFKEVFSGKINGSRQKLYYYTVKGE